MRILAAVLAAVVLAPAYAQAQYICPPGVRTAYYAGPTYYTAAAPVYTAPVYTAPVYTAAAPVRVSAPTLVEAPAPVTSYYVQPAPSYAWRPVVPVVPVPSTYYVGRGVIGQPTVYVPGQPIRNALRFLSP